VTNNPTKTEKPIRKGLMESPMLQVHSMSDETECWAETLIGVSSCSVPLVPALGFDPEKMCGELLLTRRNFFWMNETPLPQLKAFHSSKKAV